MQHPQVLLVAHPMRAHPTGVVVGRLAHIGEPVFAVQRVARDLLGALPGLRLGDDVGNAVASEGELAGEMPVRVLVDHRADVLRIIRREHAVEHDLRHRLLEKQVEFYSVI